MQANFSFDVVVNFGDAGCIAGAGTYPSVSNVLGCGSGVAVPAVDAKRAYWLRPAAQPKKWSELHPVIPGADEVKAMTTVDKWLERRYIPSDQADADGTSLIAFMRGPGVALLQGPGRQYFAEDAVPFLHYVPVEAGESDASQRNISETVQQLEADQTTSQIIAESGAAWAAKHRTMRTDHRQWKLFYHLLYAVWNRSVEVPSVPPKHRNTVTCEFCGGLAEITGYQGDVEDVWRRTCAEEGLEMRLFPEATDVATQQLVKDLEVAVCYQQRESRLFAEDKLAEVSKEPTRIDYLRAAALDQWNRDLKRDYLKEVERRYPHKAHIVRSVCGPVKDKEEKWMCERRGLRMAKRMQLYKSVSREHSDDVVNHISHSPHRAHDGNPKDEYESGFRITVRDGEVENWSHFGRDIVQPYLNVIVGKVFEGIQGGAMPRNGTFDLIVMTGDVHRCWDSKAASRDHQPPYPVIRYSVTSNRCPNHIALPNVDALQVSAQRSARPYKAWEDLTARAVFRGSLNNHERLHIAIMSALKVHPMLDAFVTSAREYKQDCRQYVERQLREGNLPSKSLTPQTVGYLCEEHSVRNVPSIVARGFSNDEVLEYKYVIAVDGYGAPLRLSPQLRGPGVLLTMRNTWDMEEYFWPDLVPWVHYVPLTRDKPTMPKNISDTLNWLEKNQDAARNIAEESTRWAFKHRTHKTDHREWKMFYYFLNEVWDTSKPMPRPTHVPPKLSCATCTGLSPITDHGILPDVWRLACGDQGLNKGLVEEATDPATLAYLQRLPQPASCFPRSPGWLPGPVSPGYATLLSLRDARVGAWRAHANNDANGWVSSQAKGDAASNLNDVVSTVCNVVQHSNDKWICNQRAARMARQMKRFSRLTRRDALAAVEVLRKRGEPGVHIEIEGGEIKKWSDWGGAEDTTLVSAAVGTVLEGIRGGTMPASFSFDLVVSFGGKCAAAPATQQQAPVSRFDRRKRGKQVAERQPESAPPAEEAESLYPIIRQRACGHGDIVLPYQAGLHPVAESAPVQAKQNTVAFVSAREGASLEQVTNSIDARLHKQCRELAEVAVRVPSFWDVAQQLSKATDMSVRGDLYKQTEAGASRYVFATDTSVACGLTLAQLRGGKAVLMMENHLREEYYYQDLVPWVHYVPVSSSREQMMQNFTDTMYWLDDHPEQVREIAHEARMFVKHHANTTADHRQWKLFYHFLSKVWAVTPTGDARKASLSCSSCEGLDSMLAKADPSLKQKLWMRTCGGSNLDGQLLLERRGGYRDAETAVCSALLPPTPKIALSTANATQTAQTVNTPPDIPQPTVGVKKEPGLGPTFNTCLTRMERGTVALGFMWAFISLRYKLSVSPMAILSVTVVILTMISIYKDPHA
eukprot:TRINITY_DN6811_c0_g2_i3.p1 TRINITY_DN6811_c0_g2~~TRINITY_DN6811_c0_g2_i3.p1  ORF type:complete len:1398 (+),score=512.73 TRINITY_DN6811_c0_g2_i3:82-4194(+)